MQEAEQETDEKDQGPLAHAQAVSQYLLESRLYLEITASSSNFADMFIPNFTKYSL
jgi:hypothetical protein